MIKIKAMYEDENELKRAVVKPLEPFIIRMKNSRQRGVLSEYI